LRNLTEEPISAELNEALLSTIKEKKWWQGSVIPASSLGLEDQSDANYWVIATQACNLYNPNFEKVPVFELVAARQIDGCNPQMIKGDNPRVLHVKCELSANAQEIPVKHSGSQFAEDMHHKPIE
jgi:hypothetical protein